MLTLRDVSPPHAVARASELRAFDPHLAEVAGLLAALLVADGREASAVGLYEVAAALWGADTEKGQRASPERESLRRRRARARRPRRVYCARREPQP